MCLDGSPGSVDTCCLSGCTRRAEKGALLSQNSAQVALKVTEAAHTVTDIPNSTWPANSTDRRAHLPHRNDSVHWPAELNFLPFTHTILSAAYMQVLKRQSVSFVSVQTVYAQSL